MAESKKTRQQRHDEAEVKDTSGTDVLEDHVALRDDAAELPPKPRDLSDYVAESEVIGEAVVPNVPTVNFAGKATLTDADHKQALLNRIGERERAIAAGEVELFEATLMNNGAEVQRLTGIITQNYQIVQALVNAHNEMYGDS